MKKKSIIFDVDGTIWDSTESIAKSYNATMNKLGIKGKHITVSLVHSFMGFITEDIAAKVFPEYPFEKQMEYIEMCMNDECGYLRKHPGTLYKDVEKVLNELSEKYHLYIVSNCQDGYIETLYSVYDIEKYIKDYECSGRTGMKKGDNIRLIMQRNGIEDAVYVGDTQKDKEASLDANIPFIYASYGFGKVDDYERKIDTFAELLDFL